MFLRNFFILLAILVVSKISLCAWRIYIGKDRLSLEYYLGIVEWKKEFLKIAVLAFLAFLFSWCGA